MKLLHGLAALVREYADYLAGACAFAATVVIADRTPAVLQQASPLLGSELAVGLALLAVVLAALAIFVTFMSEEYVMVLRQTKRGINGALRPYRYVALWSALTALVSLATQFLWAALNTPGQTTALAIASGLAVVSLVGALQLVFITAHHGRTRESWLEVIRNFRESVHTERATPREGNRPKT